MAYNTIVTTSEPISTPSPSPTVKPSPNPTVSQTPQPTSQPTVAPTHDTEPTITPEPKPTTPSCTITYCEMGRTYDANSNVTKLQIRILIRTQGITDGLYSFYINNFYLTENGVPVPDQVNKGVTSKVPLKSVSILTEPIFEVTGDYTSSSYVLSYDNFPIEVSWDKQPFISLV